ncbi:MAG: BLUF domain-containing protein [Burkholderiaceae bacterium]|jgi:hypothetical protein
MNALVNLIYTSLATDKFNKCELDGLLNVCRKNNGRCHLTGLLIFHAGVFIQWIEGLESDVSLLWEKIKLDDRHDNLVQIEYGPISQRFFPEWWMGYSDPLTADAFPLSLSERDINELTHVPSQPWLAVDILFRQAAFLKNNSRDGATAAGDLTSTSMDLKIVDRK